MELIDPSSEFVIASRCVRVCQSKSCCKSGAAKVLTAFQAHPVAGVEVVGCGCLGQCGNGPMVVISPDQVWYGQVRSEEVRAIVTRHLQNGQPIKAMLYSKFHPQH